MVEQTEVPHAGAAGRRLGFWAAALTAALTAAAFAIGITTLPLSGPSCTANCVVYPYREVANLVPHDYIWMYPAILLMGIFVVLLACLHQAAAENRRLYSLLALVFGAMAALLLAADYYIQIAALQPSILRGEWEGAALITQYNPHGIFIALEELGYLLMSLAFLFAGLAFAHVARLERAIRWLLIGGALAVFAVYAAQRVIYGLDLEYRFEVTAIAINWTLLIVLGILLSIWFRRRA
ncbi:MAG: hypothetical protein U0X20_18340 [Caldilineaceae bacterium]